MNDNEKRVLKVMIPRVSMVENIGKVKIKDYDELETVQDIETKCYVDLIHNILMHGCDSTQFDDMSGSEDVFDLVGGISLCQGDTVKLQKGKGIDIMLNKDRKPVKAKFSNVNFEFTLNKRDLIVTAANGTISTDTILWDGNDYHNQLQVGDAYFDMRLNDNGTYIRLAII